MGDPDGPRLSYEAILAANRSLPLDLRIAAREEDLHKLDLAIHKVDTIFYGPRGAPHKITREVKELHQEASYVRQLVRLDQPEKAKEGRYLPSPEEIYEELLSPEMLATAARRDEDYMQLVAMTRCVVVCRVHLFFLFQLKVLP